MQIYISGSLAYDRIMDFPGRFEDHILPENIHVLNVCFLVNGLTEKFGGTAGNIAYSLSMLGERPLILATAGRDFEQYGNRLKMLGLSLDGIRKIPRELTAGAYITTDLSDNQITGFYPGAMKYPSRYPFDRIAPSNSLAIIAPGNIEDMVIYSRKYKSLGIPYIFDPGQQITALTDNDTAEMITGADVFISNDYELELVKRATGWRNSGLLERCKAVITTLGEKGSRIKTLNDTVEIPAVAADQVRDPTGAGDGYRAGLLKGMMDQKSLAAAGRMGAVCASFVVEEKGTQEHRFDLEAFNSRYRAAFGEN